MKSKVAEWFETKIRYDKLMDDGMQKPITEAYVVEAFNFTEAEETITDEMSAYISGEFRVNNISKASYKEVFFSENPRDDRWYKVKIQLIILDEKTGKEKLSAITYLVQSANFQGAVKNIEEVMNSGLQDWKIASIAETNIIDVYERGASGHVNKPEEDDRPEYEDAMRAELEAERAESGEGNVAE